MPKILLLLLSAIILTGCANNKKMVLNRPFDEKLAHEMLMPGKNEIKGSALLRQVGGGIVTCAGNQVFLMPVTERARQWTFITYGSDEKGYFDVSRGGYIFEGADKLFSMVKTTNCDAQGNFIISDIADGQFFAFTRITWHSGGYIQGGTVMQKVSLSGAQKINIVLSGQ
jgi:hypothetical protein